MLLFGAPYRSGTQINCTVESILARPQGSVNRPIGQGLYFDGLEQMTPGAEMLHVTNVTPF